MEVGLCRNCDFCRSHGIRFSALNDAFRQKCEALERQVIDILESPDKSYSRRTVAINKAAERLFPTDKETTDFADAMILQDMTEVQLRRKIREWGLATWVAFADNPVCVRHGGFRAPGYRQPLWYPPLPLLDVVSGEAGCEDFGCKD